MGDISADKKLELVHQIRSQYYQNQSDLLNREQILYKKTGQETAPVFKNYSKWLRLALSAVLLLLVIWLEQTGQSFCGVTSGQIFDMLAVDYRTELLQLFNDLPAQ